MISLRDRIVFVHLRRTGGNSIEVALGGVVLLDRWFRPTMDWDNQFHRGRSWRKIDRRGHRIHSTAEEIRRLHPRAFDQCFKFAIVRNPWEQMASLYGRLHADDRAFAGFRHWLWRFGLEKGTVPRASLYDRSGRSLVDFVGRFERLQDDFDEACDRAGVPRRTLPRTTPSAGRPLAEIYDAAAMAIVRRIFAHDIEDFGYSFDSAASPRSTMSEQAAA